jgi:hypothetical protein
VLYSQELIEHDRRIEDINRCNTTAHSLDRLLIFFFFLERLNRMGQILSIVADKSIGADRSLRYTACGESADVEAIISRHSVDHIL